MCAFDTRLYRRSDFYSLRQHQSTALRMVFFLLKKERKRKDKGRVFLLCEIDTKKQHVWVSMQTAVPLLPNLHGVLFVPGVLYRW